jgi:hypothetical protein
MDCNGIPVGLYWNDFLGEGIKEAETQGVDMNGRGFSIPLKKNGRLRQRTECVNFERMVCDDNARESSDMDVRNI